jgi:hypothetical protein
MSDNKLDELIEKYGSHKYMQSQAMALYNAGSFSAKKGVRESNMLADRAKQDIVDYAMCEKQDATKAIREVWEKNFKELSKDEMVIIMLSKTTLLLDDIVCAIKTDGLNAGWVKEKK